MLFFFPFVVPVLFLAACDMLTRFRSIMLILLRELKVMETEVGFVIGVR